MKIKLKKAHAAYPAAKPGDILDLPERDLATAHELVRTGAAEALQPLPPLKRERAKKRPDLPDGPALVKLLPDDKGHLPAAVAACCPGKKPGDVVRFEAEDAATVRHLVRNRLGVLVDWPPAAAMKGEPPRSAAKPEAKGRTSKTHAEPDPDNASDG